MKQKIHIAFLLVKYHSKIQLVSLASPVSSYNFSVFLTTDTILHFEVTILLKFHDL